MGPFSLLPVGIEAALLSRSGRSFGIARALGGFMRAARASFPGSRRHHSSRAIPAGRHVLRGDAQIQGTVQVVGQPVRSSSARQTSRHAAQGRHCFKQFSGRGWDGERRNAGERRNTVGECASTLQSRLLQFPLSSYVISSLIISLMLFIIVTVDFIDLITYDESFKHRTYD